MIDEKALIVIYKEKAHEESKQKGVVTYEGDIHSSGFVSGVLWAIEIAKAQPTIGEWIPCSERLPQKDGRYLITIPHIGVVPNLFNKSHKLPWGSYVTERVVAWMPLPEPWEGEK